jgi:hypothetical protein
MYTIDGWGELLSKRGLVIMGGRLGEMEDMIWDRVDEDVKVSGIGILAPLQEHLIRTFIPFFLVVGMLKWLVG